MKVLMITGDKSFAPGHPRFNLQAQAVEKFNVVYWGGRSLWPAIPRGDFDVVTVQDPFLRGLFAWGVARRLRTRFNVQIHADLDAQPFWKHVLTQVVLRHADSVRVVSAKIKKQVERMGVKTKTSVLPVFIDVSNFTSVRRRPHEGKNILWIGRFEAEKNPLLAVDVLKEVLKTENGARLTMLGEGTLTSALSAYAAYLPIELPGWKDPTSYLEIADIVLSTSPAESFGASIVEALAARVPVVALDVGVAKEAGAVVVPQDKLAEAVVDVLRFGAHAELKLHLLESSEWAEAWKNSL